MFSYLKYIWVYVCCGVIGRDKWLVIKCIFGYMFAVVLLAAISGWLLNVYLGICLLWCCWPGKVAGYLMYIWVYVCCGVIGRDKWLVT